jgi:hypothetical protein
MDFTANYAGKLLAMGMFAKADVVIQRGLAVQPANTSLLILRAEKRIAMGEAQAAIAEFAGFVNKKRQPELMRALARLLRGAGRLPEALALLLETQKADAPDVELRREALDLALCTGSFATARTLGFTAEASIRAVHVDAEVMAGHSAGEIIRLAQMLPMLAEDQTATLYADPEVAALAALVPGLAIRPLGEKPEESVPLAIVLPVAIGASADPTQLLTPLEIDPGRKAAWQRALSEHARPAIGLLWAEGMPGLSLAELVGALDHLGTLVSLAVGSEREALAEYPAVLDAGAHIDGPDDLAAAISALDFVISVDALALSLAGGLGCPGLALVEQTGSLLWASRNGEACWAPSISVVPFGPGQTAGAHLARMADTARQRLAALSELPNTSSSPNRSLT